ncbi:hypothetical protein DPEC_G00291400 [Dallia pectoralis]|uniref:Uncharacterized protein n=1 Tax=Dallia pectoralis TaxID=75939 RepID=A0ACC2FHQ8_DALPE|nr:hypothetical protein DPEC_G00291400 [Dallia pectoralis]
MTSMLSLGDGEPSLQEQNHLFEFSVNTDTPEQTPKVKLGLPTIAADEDGEIRRAQGRRRASSTSSYPTSPRPSGRLERRREAWSDLPNNKEQVGYEDGPGWWEGDLSAREQLTGSPQHVALTPSLSSMCELFSFRLNASRVGPVTGCDVCPSEYLPYDNTELPGSGVFHRLDI